MKQAIIGGVLTSLLVFGSSVATSTQTAPGAGLISGTVIDAETSKVVSGAAVILTPNASYPEAGEILRVATDSRGQFIFAGLPVGTYRLFIRAAGFSTRENGIPETVSLGTPISLATDQRLAGLFFSVVPVGTITGDVQTHDGLPAARVPIKVSRSLYTPTGRIQLAVKSTSTDIRGHFRLSGLNPGRYFLSAGTEKPPSARMAEATGADDCAPQYYPGADTLEMANPIDVTSGGELNVNLKISRQKSVSVRGTIVDSQTGKPPDSVQWQLIDRPESGNTIGYEPPASYEPRTGEFELRNVWLGVYLLEARSGTELSAMSPVARTRIVVQDSGIENLHLYQIRPFEVAGRVSVDGSSEPTAQSGTVDVLPIDPQSSGRMPSSAKVAADGNFKITGLLPGEYLLRLQDSPAARTYIRDITYEANDILNFPWHFSGTGAGTIEIVRHAGTARLSGIVTNARSEPTAARVVLLPEARFRSDLYRSAASDRTGKFTFPDIVPGEYRLFAFDVLETGAEFDPDFMKSYELQGRGIHIAESLTNSMDIRTVPKP